MSLSPRRATLVIASLLALLAVSTATPAFADDDDADVIAQAKEHYKAGLDAYKAGKYDVAIRELKKAYLLKRLPPLLLNIGATYRKTGDLDLALHFYQKYLDEAPSDAKDRGEVEGIIAEIKQAKTEAPPPADDSSPPPPRRDESAGSRRGGAEWNHNIIDAAPPETPIDVRVTTPVMKGVKVYVYYRTAGQSDFTGVLMKRRSRDEKVGRIPAEAVTGRSMQYYIEAKDGAGTVVKSSGDQANPNIIMIEEGVKPVLVASSNRREEPEEATEDEDRPKKKAKASRDLDDEEAPTTGKVNLSGDNDEPIARAPKKKKASSGGLTTLQKAGIGLLAGGVGVAGILGGTFLGLAKHESSIVSDDSKLAASGTGGTIYFNNDPTVSTQDADHESHGQTYNKVGIAMIAVGAVVAVGGAGCLIADAVTRGNHDKAPAKKKKKRRVETDEEEETRWYVAPAIGPGIAAVSGGFSF